MTGGEKKSTELETMFEEMFGTPEEAQEDVIQKEEPEQVPGDFEWPEVVTIPMEEEKSLYKPSGLQCSRCSSNDASYSPHYKDQWCINCWF